jgi:hypothetical protein
MAAKVLVARESFSAEVDGQTVIVHAEQTRLASTHPLTKAHPHLFEPAEPRPDVETPKPRRRAKAT